MRIVVPFGTRPEIVKLAPVIDVLRAARHDVLAIATGQHADPLLADAFFADLALAPDVRHELPDGDSARLGALTAHAHDDVGGLAPDVVLALGDTNTVPAYALAARRHGVPFVHLEAGLRSFNPRSIEEVNRRVGAVAASLQLAPTQLAARFLLDEGVAADRIEVVGNPITDVLRRLAPPPRPTRERVGIVVTAHRATNVDTPDRLAHLVALLRALASNCAPVRFPVHPRTRARLIAAGALETLQATSGLEIEAPLRYPEMLDAVASARVVVTDSGGLQEEASWFGVPIVLLRTTTPRWEGVMAGTTILTGLDSDRAQAAVAALCEPAAQEHAATLPCPYGDGRVAPRVVDAIERAQVDGRLAVDEPPLDAPLPAAVADTTPA